MDALLAPVTAAMQDGRFDEVATSLDEAELHDPSAFSMERWPHALHLLAHIYAARLEDARFVYKRTPDPVKQASPELQAAFALLQRLWVKDYQHIWTAMQYGWSAQTQPLVAALAQQTRVQMLDLVERAYDSISPTKLAALLGCTEAEAAQAAAERGWQTTGGLVDVKPPQPTVRPGEAAAQRSLQRLAEYVVHLET
ncbi:hypothetical protein D9Q98_005855 [Chlorella vulgaris]|uniref:CSN8/PSMD8/EIF3K domain-containing protein n=1 Tax=Chlorella vulgaris TaxID=3077 RepID=A0A9D4Z0Z8_CHLVU|nr:hypothetical protein D9Q98_005855 [Chlorella vulgaris]